MGLELKTWVQILDLPLLIWSTDQGYYPLLIQFMCFSNLRVPMTLIKGIVNPFSG